MQRLYSRYRVPIPSIIQNDKMSHQLGDNGLPVTYLGRYRVLIKVGKYFRDSSSMTLLAVPTRRHGKKRKMLTHSSSLLPRRINAIQGSRRHNLFFAGSLFPFLAVVPCLAFFVPSFLSIDSYAPIRISFSYHAPQTVVKYT